MIRRLLEDEKESEFTWYANVHKNSYNQKKYIEFSLWDPVDWKQYEAYFSGSTLTFSQNSLNEEKNTVDTIRKMINFIDSEEFKNLVIDDEEYQEYIFEI